MTEYKNELKRKQVHSNNTYDFYACENGTLYKINQYNGKRIDIKPYYCEHNKNYIVCLGTRSYRFKNLIAKCFIEGTKPHDEIEQINNDPLDFSVKNLRNISLEIRKNRVDKGEIHTITEISCFLDLPAHTIQLLRKVLGLGLRTYGDEFDRVVKLADDIQDEYKRITPTTVEKFLLTHDIDKY